MTLRQMTFVILTGCCLAMANCESKESGPSGPQPAVKENNSNSEIIITTVYAIRELQTTSGDESTALSETGELQGESLNFYFSKKDLNNVFAEDNIGCQQSAEYAAGAKGLTVREPIEELNANFARQVTTTYKGQSLLVIGKTGSLPTFFQNLGYPQIFNIRDSEYGQMYKLEIDNDGEITFLKEVFHQ
tara:strand:- start:922 stop:1488 length:567 start_codon:yes stop_codon:yes gene_type:complete